MLHSMPKTYFTPGGQVYSLYRELSERNYVLIGGATGSGKSVVLNGIIHATLVRNSPFNAQFVFIDPKKVELVDYSRLPHTARYASEPGEIVNALEWALQETNRLYTAMQQYGRKEYDGPVLYIIINELADLMTTMRKNASDTIEARTNRRSNTYEEETAGWILQTLSVVHQ